MNASYLSVRRRDSTGIQTVLHSTRGSTNQKSSTCDMMTCHSKQSCVIAGEDMVVCCKGLGVLGVEERR